MEIEEMAQRLADLSNEQQAQDNVMSIDAFMNSFGNSFDNNTYLGNVLMSRLNGMVGEGAINEINQAALDQVLDSIADDCNALLKAIKRNNRMAEDMVDAIQDRVIDIERAEAKKDKVLTPEEQDMPAEGNTPYAVDSFDDFDDSEQPMPFMSEQAPAEQAPVDMPAEQMPAEQAPVEQPAEQTPVEQVPAEQMPAEQAPVEQPPVVSDIRMKRIKKMQDAWGKTLTQKKHEKDQVSDEKVKTKLSGNIISGCRG